MQPRCIQVNAFQITNNDELYVKRLLIILFKPENLY